MRSWRLQSGQLEEDPIAIAGQLVVPLEVAAVPLGPPGLVYFGQPDQFDLGMDTELIPALTSLEFSRAKSELSDVMTSVVHEHRPSIVSRHRGKERMLLVRTDDLARHLAGFGFDVEVVEDGDEVTAALPKLGLLGFGSSRAEALDDLVVELHAYAADYFGRAAFYAATDRADHAPWLLRFALTPPAEQRDLLSDT